MATVDIPLRLAFLAVIVGAIPLATGQQYPPLATLDSLKSLGEFTVSLSGSALEFCPTTQPCLYFEWVAGTKNGDAWTEQFASHHPDGPLHIATPMGPIDLPHASLRLYLPASSSRMLSGRDATAAPAHIRALLSEHPVFTLEEFLMTPGVGYHARVDTISYMLPPVSISEAPRQRHTLVLAISDLPFKDGQAQRTLAPSFRHITY